jgi:hypothetical protein
MRAACIWKIVYRQVYTCTAHPSVLGLVTFSEAWARRFRSFQRQPGTPWIHRWFFFDFSMSGPRRGKSTGNSYVNPRNSTSNVSFDMKLYEWEQRVCAIRCSQSFESLKLCSLVAILEGLTPQASHSIFVVHVLRCSMWSSVKNARNFCKRLAGEPVPLPDGRQTATDCDQVATSRWWLRSWGLCECVIEADCQQCSQAIA